MGQCEEEERYRRNVSAPVEVQSMPIFHPVSQGFGDLFEDFW
jgi:hypothetical protein